MPLEEQAATVASKAAPVVMYGGAGFGVLGWFTLTEWMAIVGALCAVAGLIVNSYYTRKDYKLKEARARRDGLL